MSHQKSAEILWCYRPNSQKIASYNQIKFRRTPRGHRKYLLHTDCKKEIIYCRVSSAKQKGDLDRQIKSLQRKFPDHEVIQDIGSGINFKRKGFLSLLQQVFDGTVSEVVVSSHDRFSRFNFEFFEWLLMQFGCKLISLNKSEDKSPEQELSEDLISVITIFTARYHGRRKYNRNKKD